MASSKQPSKKYAVQVVHSIGQKLYLNPTMADVYFVFKSDSKRKLIPAHKCYLVAASDVFEKMFNGSWKEKNEVNIVDASAAAFEEFLQFFYLKQVLLSSKCIADVMNLGKKYNINECFEVCVKFLKDELHSYNVCRAYNLAILYDQLDLKECCETFIHSNAKVVLKSINFLKSKQIVLEHILQMDRLTCSEVELFDAYMYWVKFSSINNVLTKKMVTKHLGGLFYKFRFGSMLFSEFASLVSKYSKLFSRDEYSEIIQLIADKKYQSNSFNCDRRERLEIKESTPKEVPKLSSPLLQTISFSDSLPAPEDVENLDQQIQS